MNSKEALCEILARTDKKESKYTTKCAETIVRDLEILDILIEHLGLEKVDLINITMCSFNDSDVKKIREWLKNRSVNKIKEMVRKWQI